jgi:predicted kinase
MAELADPTPVWFVECMAPAEVRIARAAAREHDPAHVSDATAELVRDEHNAFDPLDEIAPDRHLALRTDRRTPGVLADLLALLDARLADERADRSIRLRV